MVHRVGGGRSGACLFAEEAAQRLGFEVEHLRSDDQPVAHLVDADLRFVQRPSGRETACLMTERRHDSAFTVAGQARCEGPARVHERAPRSLEGARMLGLLHG